MKFFNGISGRIEFFEPEQVKLIQGKYLLKPNQDPIYIIPPGIKINVLQEELNNPDSPIRFKAKTVEKLPEDFDIYIVSSQYRCACQDLGISTTKLAIANEPVYHHHEDVTPCGYLSLLVG